MSSLFNTFPEKFVYRQLFIIIISIVCCSSSLVIRRFPYSFEMLQGVLHLRNFLGGTPADYAIGSLASQPRKGEMKGNPHWEGGGVGLNMSPPRDHLYFLQRERTMRCWLASGRPTALLKNSILFPPFSHARRGRVSRSQSPLCHTPTLIFRIYTK